ncbi:MAG: glycosyltransferase family 39 protein [Clostridia bacterium]|nr:glycosyltransferase family 39 protein [Clostridia bacterium]
MTVLRKIFNIIFIAFCATLAGINLFFMKKPAPLLFLAFYIVLAACLFIINRTGEINDKTYRIVIGITVFVGCALRLAEVLLVPCEPVSDYAVMIGAAKGVANGDFSAFSQGSYFHRFPHITFYSITAGALMGVFGQSITVIKVFNVIFKTAAIFVMALIGKEIFGKKGSILCAGLLALFPADIFYSNVCTTENFAIFFLSLSVYYIVKAYKAEKRKKSFVYCVISGLILCLGTLYRNVAPFYLAGYIVGILIVFAKGRKIISALAVLGAFIILNNAVSYLLYFSGATQYRLTDGAEPYTVYLLVGSNFETHGMYSAEDHGVYEEAKGDKEKINLIVRERITKRLTESPEKILPLLFDKTRILWSGSSFDSVYWGYINNGIEGEKPAPNMPLALCSAFFTAVFILAFVGVIKNENKELFCLIALVIMALWGGLCLMEIQPRYAFSTAYLFLPIAAGAFFPKHKETLK